MAQQRKSSNRPVRRPPPSGRNAHPQNSTRLDQTHAQIPRGPGARSGMQQSVLPMGGKPAPVTHSRNHESQKARRRRITRGEMRRRRIRRRLFACAGLLLLVILGIVLSITVLFKVSGYRVEGLDHSVPADTGIYSEEAILSALGIPTGENLFGFSLKEKEREMALALPYLETIQLRRSLPGTIVVRVSPAVERYVLSSPGGWVVVSDGLKVLKVQPEAPENLIKIEGVEPIHPAGGMPLVLDQLLAEPTESEISQAQQTSSAAVSAVDSKLPGPDTAQESGEEPILFALKQLLQQMQVDQLVDGVNNIDLTDMGEISFLFEDRVRVVLGSLNTLDYKMQWARYILLNQKGDGLQPSDRGRLDISHVRADGSIQPRFTPGPADATDDEAVNQVETSTPQDNTDSAQKAPQADLKTDPEHDPQPEE